MRCLVTGAAGFIGSHLSRRLLDEGHEVQGLDTREISGTPSFPMRRVDLLDTESVRAVLADFKPRGIFHLAARAGVRESLKSPLPYFRTNVEGTASLYEAASCNGVEKIVTASSSSVYGATLRLPMKEDDPCDKPLSFYAASKRAMELLSWTWAHVRSLDITVVRPFSVYGPSCRFNMVVHKFLVSALRNAPVEIFGNGTASRDFTYVDDVVEGLLLAYRHDGWGIFNVAGGRTVSVNELVDTIEVLLGKEITRRYLPAKTGEVQKTLADLESSRAQLGYEPSVSMQDGLKRTLEWCRSIL